MFNFLTFNFNSYYYYFFFLKVNFFFKFTSQLIFSKFCFIKSYFRNTKLNIFLLKSQQFIFVNNSVFGKTNKLKKFKYFNINNLINNKKLTFIKQKFKFKILNIFSRMEWKNVIAEKRKFLKRLFSYKLLSTNFFFKKFNNLIFLKIKNFSLYWLFLKLKFVLTKKHFLLFFKTTTFLLNNYFLLKNNNYILELNDNLRFFISSKYRKFIFIFFIKFFKTLRVLFNKSFNLIKVLDKKTYLYRKHFKRLLKNQYKSPLPFHLNFEINYLNLSIFKLFNRQYFLYNKYFLQNIRFLNWRTYEWRVRKKYIF